MQLTDKRVYPDVEGRFEDPVVWRDELQYHLIVNDWLGRIAFYQRSKDGVHWVTEQGEAYVPGVSFHKDGAVEHWFKYERPKVFQDEKGRAVQMNFAVIDTIKWNDLPNDKHSSKNISIPLNKGMLLSVLNEEEITPSTRTIAELRATLNTAKEMGYKRLIAVHQPFTYSRTKMLFNDFVDVLKIPDITVLTPIMGSREPNDPTITSAKLAAQIPGSVLVDSLQAAADWVKQNAQPGDLVITLGCGDIYKASKMMVADNQ